MKIATWNIERYDNKNRVKILEKLEEIDADILVLTETSQDISLKNYNQVSTKVLPKNHESILYKANENRVSIYSKYKICNLYETYDEYTTVCTELETPYGLLLVYGSIIGVFGNKQPKFNNDLVGHLTDFERLFKNQNICIAGDFNITFTGQAWPSKVARQKILDVQEKYKLVSETQKITNAVDHILLSEHFIHGKELEIYTWNNDKKISDHEGYMLTIK